MSQVYKVEQIKKPLENYRDIDAFKIYVSDLGLLCAKKDLAANDVLYMVEELNDFKGGMAENYVNVQLAINGYKTYYWESERGAEIDFVIQRDGELIPIEVKSADNTRAKSLKVYMETYKPAYAIKLSAKNFGFEDNKRLFLFTPHFVSKLNHITKITLTDNVGVIFMQTAFIIPKADGNFKIRKDKKPMKDYKKSSALLPPYAC